MKTHESIHAFYAEDDDRRRSPEVDYGAWWRDELNRPHRISYVRATGEVYAVAGGADPESVRVLAADESVAVFSGGDYTGAVELLASGLSETDVVMKMSGWGEQCGRPGSLQWARDRISG